MSMFLTWCGRSFSKKWLSDDNGNSRDIIFKASYSKSVLERVKERFFGGS